jgi:hypothetical protein
MPILRVANGFTQTLPGLGKIQTFSGLSEKRITKCAREALREKYCPHISVRVSCAADFDREASTWTGLCWLNGEEFIYRISTL